MALGTTQFDPTSPSTVDDATTIPSAANEVVGLLSGALSADNFGSGGSGTTINLVSATDFPSTGWLAIGGELIAYTGKSGNSLTGCTRGAQSTQIRAHADRTPAFLNFTASHFNVLRAAVIALESLFTREQYDTGTCSGGATITLTKTPITGQKVKLFVNGVFYTEGASLDFTRSGTVLTFNGSSYPPSGVAYVAIYTSTT